jgi:hypothetical protein
MDRATTATSYTVSVGTAGAGLLSLNEWALLLGIIFAALTFAVNWWYQKRREIHDLEMHAIERKYKEAHDLRERQFHEARMRKLLGSDEASGD